MAATDDEEVAAAPEAETTDDALGTDTMAEGDGGTAPTTMDDAAVAATTEATGDASVADTMAAPHDGLCPSPRKM